MSSSSLSRKDFASSVSLSRSSLYYQKKQPAKDWAAKQKIEEVLRSHPSYGHKRLALELKMNRKRVLRVMKLFGLRPYRRRGRKWLKPKKESTSFPNLLLTEYPSYPNHIWASDFTHLSFKGQWIYLATVLDLFSREIVGFSVLSNHSTQLVAQALLCSVFTHPAPEIMHSDHGSEYTSQDYQTLVSNLGIKSSMSQKGCPWENGYQESFYSQFKVDLGDPSRFESLGELVYAIYKTIHSYNTSRIHSALKMAPAEYANRYTQRSRRLLESVS